MVFKLVVAIHIFSIEITKAQRNEGIYRVMQLFWQRFQIKTWISKLKVLDIFSLKAQTLKSNCLHSDHSSATY